MIYLVTNNLLLTHPDYTLLSVDKSLDILRSWEQIQFDSETSGKDPHLCDFLCIQFGHNDIQIVVDTSTVSILEYKEILETKLLIGHNLKFDIQFLYKYNIIPTNVWDTMIIEQLLYLGYPYISLAKPTYDRYKYDFPYLLTENYCTISFSLKAVALKYLGIDIDKTIRGEIIWRGLDPDVINYAAGDVMYLEKIKQMQVVALELKHCLEAAKLENAFVRVIAYLEWCGIKIDVDKWRAKMDNDQKNYKDCLSKLNNFAVKTPCLKQFIYYDYQGDLFNGFDTFPKVDINWDSPIQVTKIAQLLGFNTSVQDKKTGETKDSVIEKSLALQKGINDEFLDLYINYKGYAKLISSFGQGHLNTINPITGRSYSVWRQLSTSSGRMSCGSTQPNLDLAKYKQISPRNCTYPNYQQLPHDEITRSCFVAEKGNLWVSCDWSAAEARLAGDIYNDQAIKDIFLKGIDSHSMYAKIFFKDQLEGIDVTDIKKLYPELRNRAKPAEFALNFGGGVTSIMSSLSCSKEEAEEIVKNYEEGFKGTAEFAKEGERKVKAQGYVLLNPITGHKMYWWDWKKWKELDDYYHSSEWDWQEYKAYHKGTGSAVEAEVREHMKAGSKWSRMARNGPTQGTCAIMLKHSQIAVFNWVVRHNYFNKIKLCALVHDEANWEYPEEVTEFPDILKEYMERAADLYCKSLPIPADAAIGDHWIH